MPQVAINLFIDLNAWLKRNWPKSFIGNSGAQAERRAEDILVSEGLQLLQRNYRIRAGEIDLIMRDGNTLVFVEVRLRKNTRYGGALASITKQKRRRISRTAEHYLQKHQRQSKRWQPEACRFDIVAFNGTIDDPHCPYQWLKAAFHQTS